MKSLFGRRSAKDDHDIANIDGGSPEFEESFLGFSLTNPTPRWEAPPWYIAGCVIFILAIMLESSFRPTPQRRHGFSLAIWTAILAVVIAAPPEWTLIPVVSAILRTRTSYPYLVVIPHCIVSVAAYRSRHENDDDVGNNNNNNNKTSTRLPIHYLQSLILPFFLYGFGGSILSDLLMGLPVTALSHPRIVPCYLLGWGLVWYSPMDVVYRSYQRKHSTVRYFLTAWEAVDAVTTPMGRISRYVRQLQPSPPPGPVVAPVMAGLLAGAGGATIRHIVGEAVSPSSLEGVVESAFWRTLCYSLLWWFLAIRPCSLSLSSSGTNERGGIQQHHCKDYGGSDVARFGLVCFHVMWTILVEMGWVQGHPWVWICRNVMIRRVGRSVIHYLRLGPRTSNTNWEEPLDGSDSITAVGPGSSGHVLATADTTKKDD